MTVNEEVIKQTNSINGVRYGCALGALHSVVAIKGAMPITHSGPGCCDKQYESIAFYNGFQGGGYAGGSVTPSCNLTEKEVVFGGEKKLRDLIKSSLKIMDAELYVVLNGCIGELVGDDIGSVVSEFQEQDVPIVFAETGGFKGNNFVGHEIIVKAIIDQYVDKFAVNKDIKEKGLINVWTELPYQSPFWRGDLEEIKRILEGAGFKVNILFGNKSKGVEEWKSIPNAEFNLVISPWLGVKTAKYLERKYKQPYLHIPVLPIGAKETAAFIRKVVDFAGIDNTKAEEFIKKEEQEYYYYLENFADFYAEYWWGLPSAFAVVGESVYNLAVSKFVVNQLGLIPKKMIITDNAPEKYRDLIKDEYKRLADDVSVEVEFIEDGYTADKILQETDFGHRPPIIFGSTWERDVAKELKGYIVEIGFPASYEVVLNRSYVGYKGALSLIEKIYSTAISKSA
ncbi:MAG: hydrogenase [Clostridium sp.]|uniref:nitrogenase component 1 n=1 Tax=Clostridium sp. DSM 8431 TaxID=1761781 RepID=UPI0008EF4E96|nr:nitrogenase component 1 [Clostridium sp. DSM 8431]MCR4944589.1 hydrogenase [Clostridium sp.]SFU76763.1 nitrogenase molybdenum-iron protein beta chain [Clostridium sp. DSM 8431]